MTRHEHLIEKLAREHRLTLAEYEALVSDPTEENTRLLREHAVRARREAYGNTVYIRGLIEIGNVCKNDCLYCGIRKSNRECIRYRLTDEEILSCCHEGYALGFRTFVLQGGETDADTDERIASLVSRIKAAYPDTAVTLSLGEKSIETYRVWREAGADRYLLRHETADAEHYARLHPSPLTLENRMRCLYELRALGYQVGCGFMVGSPDQTSATVAQDLKFIEEFKPDMCGIGPFIPSANTPFADRPAGTLEATCYLLSIIRLIHPNILLPATTALGTIHPYGREEGILSGANVVMPNLSPRATRKQYALYDNKISDGAEAAENKQALCDRMASIGYEVVTARGDVRR
ncbi:MAG: [Clostridia bacterium]|nr:[FeFe] hydrogenase H-cluster radical SAM maturase HydE [Clostridia bacterium]